MLLEWIGVLLLSLGLVAVWLNVDVLEHIIEVALRQVGLVLRWVTIYGYTTLVFNQDTQANSAWSSLHG